jgi:hypothetical protein
MIQNEPVILPISTYPGRTTDKRTCMRAKGLLDFTTYGHGICFVLLSQMLEVLLIN